MAKGVWDFTPPTPCADENDFHLMLNLIEMLMISYAINFK